ncbi:MAG: hypothetical protein ACI808_003366 [Paraglaciecola sp.]|jgi:hypothetical protein
MLKAYAVALILSTAIPVEAQSVDSVQAPISTSTPTTQEWKPGSIKD